MKNKFETDKNIAAFWLFWNEAQQHGVIWSSLTKHFATSTSLEEVINKCQKSCRKMMNNLLSEEQPFIWRDEEEIEEVLREWNEKGIFAISSFDFKNYPLLKDINDSFFFFIKGKLDLLFTTNAIAVTGSCRTPLDYLPWINKAIPKDKVIISELSFGTDLVVQMNAMSNNQGIIIFPLMDIVNLSDFMIGPMKLVIDYACINGLMITHVFPNSDLIGRNIYLKRDRWVATIAKSTYIVCLDNRKTMNESSLSLAIQTAKLQKKIYLPKEVYKSKISCIKNNENYRIIKDYLEPK